MTTIRTKDVQLKTLKVGDEFTVKPSHKRYKVIRQLEEYPEFGLMPITEVSGDSIDPFHFSGNTPVQLIKTIK